jgi:hypothetical protein
MSIYRVLPLTSVECERTFSFQNRIKTKFRASKSDEVLSSLLMLSINRPQIEKEDLLRESIIRWKNNKDRLFLRPIVPEMREQERIIE